MKPVHARPGWLLLLVWIVVGAVSVPPARPAPQLAHDEASAPSLSQSADEAPRAPGGEVLADCLSETLPPVRLPDFGLARIPRPPDLPAPRVAFALLQRPPPVTAPL